MKAIEVITFPFHVDCYPIWPKKPQINTHESPFFGFRKIETPSQKGSFRLRVPLEVEPQDDPKKKQKDDKYPVFKRYLDKQVQQYAQMDEEGLI